MNKKCLNDFIMDVFQDFVEIESMLKVLKNSTSNENCEILMEDVGNILEIVTAKMNSAKISLSKYIDDAFSV